MKILTVILFCLFVNVGVTQNFKAMIPKEKGYKEVNGIRLYYEVYGSGKPLVLLHGGGGSILHDYGALIPLLEKHFKLIGIDLQNHGRSGHRSVPQTFEQDADDVAALIKQLKIAKASFFGFSNGGSTTMQIAYRHPEIVEKIIVASAFYKREGMIPGFFDGFENATLDMMPKSLQDNFLKLNNGDRKKLQNMFDKDSQRMKNFKDWDTSVLSSIKSPALIISADQDVVVPGHVAEMQALIPQSRLLIFPATHGSYMMEDMGGKTDKKQIEFTADMLRRFLAE